MSIYPRIDIGKASSGMFPKVRMDGMDVITTLVKELEKEQAKSRDVMLAIGFRMLKFQYNHFKEEKDARGASWPPLSPGYLKRRQAKSRRAIISRRFKKWNQESGSYQPMNAPGLGGAIAMILMSKSNKVESLVQAGKYPLLQDTRIMIKSLSVDANWQSAAVGTIIKYAASHQFGDIKRNIPRREFLYFDEAGVERGICVKMLENALIKDAFNRVAGTRIH